MIDGDLRNEASEAAPPRAAFKSWRSGEEALAAVATVGVVAVGAAVFEAALIPGVILGAVAVLAPRYAPWPNALFGAPDAAGAELTLAGAGKPRTDVLSRLYSTTETLYQGTRVVSFAREAFGFLGRQRLFR